MSSAIRSHDQLDRRVQYYYVVATLNEASTATNGNVFAVATGATVDSVMSSTALAAAIGTGAASTYAVGTIFRDMGKQITVNDGLLDTAVWRRVQVVNGGASEGVAASTVDLYILTWVAAPASNYVVGVARTG